MAELLLYMDFLYCYLLHVLYCTHRKIFKDNLKYIIFRDGYQMEAISRKPDLYQYYNF